MNRHCMGHRFYVFGVPFYRCLGSGDVHAGLGEDGSTCPSCGRRCLCVSLATVKKLTIDCGRIGVVKYRGEKS